MRVYVFQRAVAKGAKAVKEPWEESDKDGTVIYATVQTVSCPHFLCLVV